MNMSPTSEAATQRPYAFVGAGDLTVAIWKSASGSAERHYAFNIFRLIPASGQVSQRFVPGDVADLVKLAHVLAATLLDDGCLSDAERQELRMVLTKLETLLPEDGSEAQNFTEDNHHNAVTIL